MLYIHILKTNHCIKLGFWWGSMSGTVLCYLHEIQICTARKDVVGGLLALLHFRAALYDLTKLGKLSYPYFSLLFIISPFFLLFLQI